MMIKYDVDAMDEVGKGNLKDWCAFCRDAAPTSKAEMLEMMKTGKSSGDAKAISDLGYQYRDGAMGLPKDRVKALKLWLEAVSIKPGLIETHFSIAEAYLFGRGAEKDIEKVIHHWKLAAIGGHERARYNLGLAELRNGNADVARLFVITARAGDANHRRAMKHFMIAARAGYDDALKGVREGYKVGFVTKDEYASTLRAHKDSQDEMKSEQREKASRFIRDLKERGIIADR